MSNTPLRIGIIGAGWFASRRHVPDLVGLPEVSVTAACRRDPEALGVFCDHFGIPGRYTDYRSMLDSESLDAVVIATPHVQHAAQTAEALERGLHVLLEKPLALTAADGETLCRLARSQGKVLLIGLNPPYWPHCHLAREWIAEGRIGTVEAVEITWINSARAVFGKEPLPQQLPGVVRPTLFRGDAAQGGGGHLMDGGQHNISELLWVTGSSASSVTAVMDQLPCDMRCSVGAVLENGAIASVTGVTDSRIGARRAHSAYFGSAGTLRLDVFPFRVTWERAGHDSVTVTEAEAPAVLSPAADLVRCIQTGQEPLGSPEHALAVTRVIEDAYTAAGYDPQDDPPGTETTGRGASPRDQRQ